MADQYIYVNTASAGGDGTTNATSGGTAAYASLNSCISTQDFTATNTTFYIYCDGSGGDDTTAVNSSSISVGSGSTVSVVVNDSTYCSTHSYGSGAAASQYHGGDRTAGYKLRSANYSTPTWLAQSDEVVLIAGLVIGFEKTGGGRFGFALQTSGTSVSKTIRDCIFTEDSTSKTSLGCCSLAGDWTLINCVGTETYDILRPYAVLNYSSIAFYNCLADGGDYSYEIFGSTSVTDVICINCVSINASTDDWYSSGSGVFDTSTSATCATSYSSGQPSFCSVTSLSTTAGVDFTNAPSYDYSVADTDSALYDAGTSTSDGYDIVLEARGATYDIGPYELASGGDTAFTANGGAFTKANQSASVSADRSVSSSAGAFTKADQAATVAADRTVSGSAGAYTKADQAATVAADRTVSGSAGAFTKADQAATVAADRTVSGSAGAFTLAAYGATISTTTDVAFTASAGAYTKADQAATVTADRTVSGSAGAYTKADQAATVTADRTVNADAGAFTLTAYGATISTTTDVAFTASAGAYTKADQAATVAADRTVSGSAGAYTKADQAATVAADRTVNADVGAFTLTAYGATVSVGDTLVDCAATSFSLTAQNATVTADRTVSAAAGAYTQADQKATVDTGPTVHSDAGAFTKTDQAAAVTADVTVNAEAASFTLEPLYATVEASCQFLTVQFTDMHGDPLEGAVAKLIDGTRAMATRTLDATGSARFCLINSRLGIYRLVVIDGTNIVFDAPLRIQHGASLLEYVA